MTRHRLLWAGEERPRDAVVTTLSGRALEIAIALEAQRTAGELAAALLSAGNDPGHSGGDSGPSSAPPGAANRVRQLTDRLAALSRALHPGDASAALTGEVVAPGGGEEPGGVRLVTGRQPSLWDLLAPLLAGAREVDLVVAYASPGGVDLIAPHLVALRNARAAVRILVGNYLGGTRPDGLGRLLGHLGGSVAARFEQSPHVHFHPKVYRVLDRHRREHLAVGSSNLSRPALTGQRAIGEAVEWTLLLDDAVAADLVRTARQRIDALWATHGVPLDAEVVRRFREAQPQLPPAVLLDELSQDQVAADATLPATRRIEPNDAQKDALARLDAVRARGDRRALVVAATGLGKTFLAAFDSRSVIPAGQPGRVLFVAHRREILTQARAAFEEVRPGEPCGVYHHGQDPSELEARHVFASIFSLDGAALDRLRAAGELAYVVIDEAHHSAAASYRGLLARLDGRAFVLGLTATPERLDGNSIYDLFDGVVAYEKSLLGAIEERWLVPFHYFGVPDPIDYRRIERSRGRFGYDEAQLSAAVRSPERQSAALAWLEHPDMGGTRTLFFCIDIAHAEDTASALRARGQRVALVHSAPGSDDRAAAIERLAAGDLQAIVSVDMLSEGVDIPAADRVVLLRPTESPTVFLQQIGRGLRKHGDKSHLTIIDLVGNHVRARLHMQLLGVTDRQLGAVREGQGLRQEHDDGRLLVIAPEAIGALRAVSGATSSIARRVEESLERLASRGDAERPSLRELLALTGYALSTLRDKYGSWFGILQAFDRATPADRALDAAPAVRALFDAVETSKRSGPHKMFVLMAMARLQRAEVTAAELAPLVRQLATVEHPFVGSAMEKAARDSDKAMERNLVKNPFHYLSESHPQVFSAQGNQLRLVTQGREKLAGFWDGVTERAEARLYEYRRGTSFAGEILGELSKQGDRGVILRLPRESARQLAPAGGEIELRWQGNSYRAKVAEIAINVVWDLESPGAGDNVATRVFCDVAGVEEARLAWGTWVRLWKRGEGVVELEVA